MRDPVTHCADGVFFQEADTAENAMFCIQEVVGMAGTDGQAIGVDLPLRHFDAATGSVVCM